jgi:hypothetical protein
MTPCYHENIQPLTPTEEQAICRVIEKIHAAMERKHGPTLINRHRARMREEGKIR